MKRLAYLTAISLIALSFFYLLLGLGNVGRMSHLSVQAIELEVFRITVINIVRALTDPAFLLRPYIPEMVETAFQWATVLLIARRVYVWSRVRTVSLPKDVNLVQLILLFTSLACITLVVASATLVLMGSDVLTPVAFCANLGVWLLTPTILWIEIASLRKEPRLAVDA